MITTLKRNELRWALSYEFRQKNPAINYDELALSIINSKERKFEINGYVVISKNETDLHYIKVFSNVRIKTFYINSIKLYYIEYASNYDLYYNQGNKKYTEFSRKNYFIDFEMILNGTRTLEEVKILNDKYREAQNKRNERTKAATTKNWEKKGEKEKWKIKKN